MSRGSIGLAAAIALMATSAAAQSSPFPVREIPAGGITFTVQCDPPIGIRKADGTIVPLDLARLAYTLSVDAGARVPDVAVCSFSFTVTTAGDHPVDVFARYRNDRGEIETSQPAHLVLQLIIDDSLTLLPPTNVVIQIRLPPIGGQTPFTFGGHEWALRPRASDGLTEILRDGAPAPDAGPGCTQLVPLEAAQTVAAFCPSVTGNVGGDGNWWLWVEAPIAPASHWANVGPRQPR